MRPTNSFATLVFIVVLAIGAALAYAMYGISASWESNRLIAAALIVRLRRFLRHQGGGSMGPGRCFAARSLPPAAGTGAVFHYPDHRHHPLLNKTPG